MKYKFEQNEIQRILEMHNKLKRSLLKEQAVGSEAQLRQMEKYNCIKDAKTRKITAPNLPDSWALVNIGTLTGDMRMHFLNGEVYQWDAKTGDIKRLGTWNVNACRSTQTSAYQSASDEQIIKNEGYLTIDQAKAKGISLVGAQTKSFGGITYYKPIGVGAAGAGSKPAEQLANVINQKYGGGGAKYSSTENATEPAEKFCWAFKGDEPYVSDPQWVELPLSNLSIDPKRFGYPTDTKIMVNPSCRERGATSATSSRTSLNTELNITNESCKNDITLYYNNYNNSLPASGDSFIELKNKVKRCAAKFCQRRAGNCEGNWKLGLGGGSNRLDDIIDFFNQRPNKIGTLDYNRINYGLRF